MKIKAPEELKEGICYMLPDGEIINEYDLANRFYSLGFTPTNVPEKLDGAICEGIIDIFSAEVIQARKRGKFVYTGENSPARI